MRQRHLSQSSQSVRLAVHYEEDPSRHVPVSTAPDLQTSIVSLLDPSSVCCFCSAPKMTLVVVVEHTHAVPTLYARAWVLLFCSFQSIIPDNDSMACRRLHL